jgi:PPOX class probable F420-dependent enzyme
MTPRISVLDRLGAARYLLVTTFRRTGTPVPTPVWAAPDGDSLVVWTVVDSGKVKRIRHTDRVEVAPCTMRGRPHGVSVPATAEILDAAGTDRVRELIKNKYGLAGALTVKFSLWRRGCDGTVGLRITPVPHPA